LPVVFVCSHASKSVFQNPTHRTARDAASCDASSGVSIPIFGDTDIVDDALIALEELLSGGRDDLVV
jgi:hypothetical protein